MAVPAPIPPPGCTCSLTPSRRNITSRRSPSRNLLKKRHRNRNVPCAPRQRRKQSLTRLRLPLHPPVGMTSGAPLVETGVIGTATGTTSAAKNNAVRIVDPLANSMMVDATRPARKRALPLLPAISPLLPPSRNRKSRHRARNRPPVPRSRSSLPPRSRSPLLLLNRPLRMSSVPVSETDSGSRQDDSQGGRNSLNNTGLNNTTE